MEFYDKIMCFYWFYKNAGLYAIPYRESGFRDVIMDKIDLTYESDFDENDSNYFSMSVGKEKFTTPQYAM